MYFTVIEKRQTGIIYTGMSNVKKEGLLERAKKAFPQYNNLQVIEKEGELTQLDLNWKLPF